jgi:hypothetical protein
MAKNSELCFVVTAVIVVLSTIAVTLGLANAQQSQSMNNSSNATSGGGANMSNFPTRTTPGNITNSTAAANVTMEPPGK